jgi:hypothetical protein
MIQPMAKAHAGQFGGGARAGIGHAGQFHRRHHVFQRGHRGQQVEGLQHHADPSAPRGGQRIFVHPREIGPGHLQPARGGAFKPGQHRHQRTFARSRWPEQCQGLALRHGQVDPAQDFHRAGTLAKRQGERGGRDGRGRIRGLGACHRDGMP